MPRYLYVVRDSSGAATSGTLQATDPGELRRVLRGNNLFLTEFEQIKGPTGELGPKSNRLFHSPRPRPRDLVIAARQLATFVRAGVPLTEALEVVRVQGDREQLQEALFDIQGRVVQGGTISTGMKKYPKIFSPLLIALTEAGETSGTLDQTLEAAAEQMDREVVLREKIRVATLYPKIVVVASCVVVAIMLLFFVPIFADVYGQFGAQLPGITRFLIGISSFFVKTWWLFGLAIFGSWLAFRSYKSTPKGQRHIDEWNLRLPVIGNLLRKIAIARFCITLAGALKGGVPVLQALSISANTANNSVIRDAINETAAQVRDGATIGQELEKSGEFPLMVTRMMMAGETSGNVDQMLEEINKFYERDVDYDTQRLTRLIEPVMTIVVGSIVLFVLVALYSPVFHLGEAFRQEAMRR